MLVASTLIVCYAEKRTNPLRGGIYAMIDVSGWSMLFETEPELA